MHSGGADGGLLPLKGMGLGGGGSAPLSFRTPFNCFAVEWSPFEESVFAVATAQYFGIVGNGLVHVCTDVGSSVIERRKYLTNDGQFDLTWSEVNENQLATGGADGSIKIFDIHSPDEYPIAKWQAHDKEIGTVDWNLVEKRSLVSASWDHKVKLWDAATGRCMMDYTDHTFCVYSAQWSPREPNVFVTGGGDRRFNLFDTRVPRATQSIGPVHADEIMTVDWNKYNPNVVASGSVDRYIHIWDVRKPAVPLHSLAGHHMAVRRLKFSPHSETVVLSASYDMSVAIWDYSCPIGSELVQHAQHHTEFACGIDFHLYRPNVVASCAWDRSVATWDLAVGPPPPIPRLPAKPVPPIGAGAGGNMR